MKKKINIFLLLFVVGLWGTVIYKYVSQYFLKKEMTVLDSNTNGSSQKMKLKEKDSFNLELIARDPFLNKTYQVKSELRTYKKSYNTTIKNINQKQKNEVFFPSLSYFGYIKSENGVELVLIKIDGKFFKIKRNELKEGLRVDKIYKDSIQVSYEGLKKIIKK